MSFRWRALQQSISPSTIGILRGGRNLVLRGMTRMSQPYQTPIAVDLLGASQPPGDACSPDEQRVFGSASAGPPAARDAVEREASPTPSGSPAGMDHSAENCAGPHFGPLQSEVQHALQRSAARDCWAGTNLADPEPAMSTNQALRHSARQALVAAEVSPAMMATQASRASAREARIAAVIRAREADGRIWPPWRLADGSSGERWVHGFRAIVKNTFVDLEALPPSTAIGSSYLRVRSLP